VNATASSGLPVSFVAAYQCSVSGTTVHLTGAGSCLITASQGGDAGYNPAPDVQRSFIISIASVAGSLVDIGPVTSNNPFSPTINASGQVAATSADTQPHASLWSPASPNATTGAWTDLGTLGGDVSEAYGINDLGE